MSEFENWFKTTSAYRMLESMNYYKMDLFHWVEVRGEYRHTSVQITFMTWVEQQAKIDELEKQNQKLQKQFNFLLDKNIRNESEHATLKLKFIEIGRLIRSLRNEFDLNDDCQQVEHQIELLEEALRGERE